LLLRQYNLPSFNALRSIFNPFSSISAFAGVPHQQIN
jgi:hypothetical protein